MAFANVDHLRHNACGERRRACEVKDSSHPAAKPAAVGRIPAQVIFERCMHVHRLLGTILDP